MVPNEDNLINKARTLNFPTPFFYTSKDILKTNYETFANLFEGDEVYYAVKANADTRILSFLNELGCGFEAASFYEIESLLSVGVDPRKIVYGTSVKPAEHIKKAFDAGVDRFAADSREELEKLAQHAPGSRVLVRAKVNDSGSVFAFSERFGMPLEAVKHAVRHAHQLGLKTYGISFHVGSQATHVEHWANAIKHMNPIISQLLEEGIAIDVIDIGGGFPVKYRNHQDLPHLAEIRKLVKHEIDALPYQPKVIMEPGRGMVATSTVMVAEVISRTIRNARVWLVLDGGIYNGLYEAMIHQGATQYKVHTAAMPEDNTEYLKHALTGPTGDSLDVITREVRLPAFLDIGDRLIFENAGAYTVTMACPFNGFPKPELYLG